MDKISKTMSRHSTKLFDSSKKHLLISFSFFEAVLHIFVYLGIKHIYPIEIGVVGCFSHHRKMVLIIALSEEQTRRLSLYCLRRFNGLEERLSTFWISIA